MIGEVFSFLGFCAFVFAVYLWASLPARRVHRGER